MVCVRIGVTGPRQWTDREAIELLFFSLYEDTLDQGEQVTLIEGEAKGFDLLCRSVGEMLGWVIEPYAVKTLYDDNGKFDPSAGHKRNQRMVDTGADYGIAGIMQCRKPEHSNWSAHPTHGTQDCINRVRRAGIELIELETDGD